jgi:lipopolysaccharide export LptBFGC system permease protein LptF
MRLLDRYITREVASHAVLGLAVFTFVFFVPQLVRLMDLIVRHSGSTWTVLELFLCSLPPVLTFTLPMAVLVGVLIGLGRLSADSEIVALHACAAVASAGWICGGGVGADNVGDDVLAEPGGGAHAPEP